MKKTVDEAQELNYKCKHCGATVYNATKKQINCTNCGKKITEIHPIGSKKQEVK